MVDLYIIFCSYTKNECYEREEEEEEQVEKKQPASRHTNIADCLFLACL